MVVTPGVWSSGMIRPSDSVTSSSLSPDVRQVLGEVPGSIPGTPQNFHTSFASQMEPQETWGAAAPPNPPAMFTNVIADCTPSFHKTTRWVGGDAGGEEGGATAPSSFHPASPANPFGPDGRSDKQCKQ
jgi:hypothetical protein